METRLFWPITAIGGNEASLVTMNMVSLRTEETVKCERGDWGLWRLIDSGCKNCNRMESMKGLLVETRETFCSQV